MNVTSILLKKGYGAATVEPDTKISDAVLRMQIRNIGALIVSEDRHDVGGLISERDIIFSLADFGAEILEFPVRVFMTKNIITCQPHHLITDVMAIMTDNHIRHVPVVEPSRILGIVSIGDIIKSRVDELQAESDEMVRYIRYA